MRQVLFGLCLLGVLALAGCGGGSNSPAGSRISSLSITPGNVIVRTGRTRAFIFRIQGTGSPDTRVVWSADNGTIDNNGVFLANGNQGTAHVTVTSVVDPTKSATANVTVSDTAGPTFILDTSTPATQTLDRHFFNVAANGTLDLSKSIKVVGATNTAILWSVVTPGGGTIGANGVYQAPSANGNYLIQYSAAADPSQSDFVYAVVGPLPSGIVTSTLTIILPPDPNGVPSARLTVGTTYRFGFTLTVQNSNDTSVTWSVNNGASIGGDGTFTAPHAGNFTVTVTSVASGQAVSAIVTAQ
jgi:hypothetical protein